MSRFLGGILQKAQKIKEKTEQVKNELKSKEVTATSDDGSVSVVATGDRKLKSIDVNNDAFGNPVDAEKMKEAIFATANDALEKAGRLQKEAAKKAMDEIGLNLPEIF